MCTVRLEILKCIFTQNLICNITVFTEALTQDMTCRLVDLITYKDNREYSSSLI